MGLHVWLSRRRYKGGIRGKLRVGTTVGGRHQLTHKKTPNVDYDLELSLSRIRRLEAVDPWPSLRIAWNHGRGEKSETLHPLRLHKVFAFDPDEDERSAFARVVEELLAAFEEFEPTKVARGWLEVPEIPWEKVESWPEASGPSSEGAYRTAQVPIVARRGKPSPFEALLTWLASSPERPWTDTAREMVLTSRQLYVRHWNRNVYTLPLEALRARLDDTWEGTRDAVYVFGRNTFLVVPHREGCEVTAALDRQLADRGPRFT